MQAHLRATSPPGRDRTSWRRSLSSRACREAYRVQSVYPPAFLTQNRWRERQRWAQAFGRLGEDFAANQRLAGSRDRPENITAQTSRHLKSIGVESSFS